MSADKVYARVVDGKIAEYPVLPIHITNRGQPFSWYTEVEIGEKPEVPEFFSLKETLKVVGGKVYASYSLEAESLNTVLNRINNPTGAMPLAGEEPAPVAFNDVPAASVQRVIELAREMVQKRLDAFANERNYDGILSAASYATSSNQVFSAEGQKAVDARDQSWAALYTYLGKVQAGVLPVPKTDADIAAELPVLSWA